MSIPINLIISSTILALIFSLVVLNKNLIVGYIGYLHFAGVAFFAIGAYTFAILVMKGFGFFPATLLAGIAAAIGGLILGLPTLRLRSHYIGIASLGFLIIVHSLIINLEDLTRGALGIPGIPRPFIFGFKFDDDFSFLILTLIFTIIIGGFIYRMIKSSYGKTLETIRENDLAARSIGKNTYKFKLQTYVISAFFTGIAGCLYASYINYIGPSDFFVSQAIFMLAALMVGGAGSFWGSFLGTFILYFTLLGVKFLPISPNAIGPVQMMIYSLILILLMLFRPRGILGRKIKVFERS